jgi:hypothetical protein
MISGGMSSGNADIVVGKGDTTMKNVVKTIVLSCAALAVISCVREVHEAPRPGAIPPVQKQESTIKQEPQQTTVIMQAPVAPPPLQVEHQPMPPTPAHVWIAGHWSYDHGAWVWQSGYYERGVQPGAAWVPGHWVDEGAVWTWKPGHWQYGD